MARPFPLATRLTAIDAVSPTLTKISRNGAALGKKLQGIGRSLSISVSAPIAALGFSVGRTIVDFESQMNRVQGLTGETGETFDRLRNQAKDLGRTTAFSAAEAAAGQAFLAQAGFKTEQILAAMPSTLQLAAAGQLELADASDIASNVLSAFGIDAARTSSVVDALAFGAANANTNVQQLGEAVKFVGPIARGTGVPLQEVVGLIGALSDQGIQAEMAGTGLRGAIAGLVKPSSEAVTVLRRLGFAKSDLVDGQGQLRSFTGIIEQLARAGATSEDIFTIFGQRPGSAVQALTNLLDSQGIDALRGRVDRVFQDSAGSAQRLADSNLQGLPGALKKLQSSWEGLKLALGDAGVTNAFQSAADSGKRLLDRLSSLEPGTLRVGGAIAGVAAAIGPLLIGTGLMAKGLAFALGPWWKLSKAVVSATLRLLMFSARGIAAGVRGLAFLARGALGAARVFMAQLLPAVLRVGVAMFANPFGLAVAGIAALIAAGVALYKNWDKVSAFLSASWKHIRSLFGDGVAWVTSKLDALGLGRIMSFLGFDGPSPASAPPVNAARTAAAVAPGVGQNGRARVEVDVRSGREDVRARVTAADDVELQLEQGLTLGVIG